MGLFSNLFGNRKQTTSSFEPNWDSFQALMFLEKQPFTFNPTNYKIWVKGKILKEGITKYPITAIVYDDGSKTKQFKINISDKSLQKEIRPEIYYDEYVTAKNRLQLITIPEKSKTANSAVSLFKMTIGATRYEKEFSSDDPFCCNLFLLNGRIKKVTFSFSNPDKLLEFESVLDKEEELYDKLLMSSKIMLQGINQRIASKIENQFKTVVNDFGCLHCSEERYNEFTSKEYRSKFIWCNYFVIPVDYDYKLILPKTYYNDTKGTFTDIIDRTKTFKREEYFDNLINYGQLQRFVEQYTAGGDTVIAKIMKSPLKQNKENLIDHSEEIEDLRYLVLCYYIDEI